MISIEIKVADADLLGLFSSVAALDLNPFLDDAGAFVLNRIRTRFLDEKDADNQPWPPSKAAIKRRRSGGSGTLFDTGKLFHSIQYALAGPNQRVVGTDVPYGVFHQYGTEHLIKRTFIGVNDNDALILEKLLSVRLQGIVDRLVAGGNTNG